MGKFKSFLQFRKRSICSFLPSKMCESVCVCDFIFFDLLFCKNWKDFIWRNSSAQEETIQLHLRMFGKSMENCYTEIMCNSKIAYDDDNNNKGKKTHPLSLRNGEMSRRGESGSCVCVFEKIKCNDQMHELRTFCEPELYSSSKGFPSSLYFSTINAKCFTTFAQQNRYT